MISFDHHHGRVYVVDVLRRRYLDKINITLLMQSAQLYLESVKHQCSPYPFMPVAVKVGKVKKEEVRLHVIAAGKKVWVVTEKP